MITFFFVSQFKQTMSIYFQPKEEPETIRKWREDYARLLQEKDQRENVQVLNASNL